MSWIAPSASVAMVYEECCRCGMVFAMTSSFRDQCRQRQNGKRLFFCPAGHEQYYTGETEEQRLRGKVTRLQSNLEFQKARASRIELQRRAAVGQTTKLKNRIKKGVCPFCNRHFENIQRHMESKHSEEKVC